jgi:hypothetical protein
MCRSGFKKNPELPYTLRREAYQELGGDYFERRKPATQIRQLLRQLEKLGVKLPAGVVPVPA